MTAKYYQIDEVAKLTELTKRTIRYYEDMELFKPIRTEAGYRLYDEENISTILEIKNYRVKLGLTLPQVKQILGLKSKLNTIYTGDIGDSDYIEEVKNTVTELLNMIHEKEAILQRVKENCNAHLTKLDSILNSKEGEINEK